jgi:hypothetical protein
MSEHKLKLLDETRKKMSSQFIIRKSMFMPSPKIIWDSSKRGTMNIGRNKQKRGK